MLKSLIPLTIKNKNKNLTPKSLASSLVQVFLKQCKAHKPMVWSLNIFQESTRYKIGKTPLMLKLLASLEFRQN